MNSPWGVDIKGSHLLQGADISFTLHVLRLWSSCQRFGTWFYLTPPHLAKPTLEFLSTVDGRLTDAEGSWDHWSVQPSCQCHTESDWESLRRASEVEKRRSGRKEVWWDGWSVLAVSLGHCCVLWLSIPMWFSSAMSHRVQSHWVQSGSSTERLKTTWEGFEPSCHMEAILIERFYKVFSFNTRGRLHTV